VLLPIVAGVGSMESLVVGEEESDGSGGGIKIGAGVGTTGKHESSPGGSHVCVRKHQR
jgi:hypothetical protein